MAKSSQNVLCWSEENQRYELSTAGHHQQSFVPGDKQSLQDWLSHESSFAFQGQNGHISALKESRSRGTGYWYAYKTSHRKTSKRYLGPLTKITLGRLEEVAQTLTTESAATSRTKPGSVARPRW